MIRRAIVVVAALLAAGCVHFAHAQTSSKARVAAFAKLPDWSGLWEFDIWTDELDGQQMGPKGMERAKVYAAEMQATFTPAWQAKLAELKKVANAAENCRRHGAARIRRIRTIRRMRLDARISGHDAARDIRVAGDP